MLKDDAKRRAMRDAVNHYGRNYSLPVVLKDTGASIIASYPAQEPGMMSGGWYSNGKPAFSVTYPYEVVTNDNRNS